MSDSNIKEEARKIIHDLIDYCLKDNYEKEKLTTCTKQEGLELLKKKAGYVIDEIEETENIYYALHEIAYLMVSAACLGVIHDDCPRGRDEE